MIAQIVKCVREGFHRTEIGGVALDQEVVQRVLDVGGELQRVVVGGPEHRVLDPELLLDPLTRLQDVHQPETTMRRI